MLSGVPPFSEATARDKWFKAFVAKKDLFWNTHSKHRGNNDYYSEEFRDLIQSMLALNPSERISVGGILSHVWMQGEIASEEEIQAEFKLRMINVH